jgi:hypothetical protein
MLAALQEVGILDGIRAKHVGGSQKPCPAPTAPPHALAPHLLGEWVMWAVLSAGSSSSSSGTPPAAHPLNHRPPPAGPQAPPIQSYNPFKNLPTGRFLDHEFKKADWDKDGKISLQDFISYYDRVAHFQTQMAREVRAGEGGDKTQAGVGMSTLR